MCRYIVVGWNTSGSHGKWVCITILLYYYITRDELMWSQTNKRDCYRLFFLPADDDDDGTPPIDQYISILFSDGNVSFFQCRRKLRIGVKGYVLKVLDKILLLIYIIILYDTTIIITRRYRIYGINIMLFDVS